MKVCKVISTDLLSKAMAISQVPSDDGTALEPSVYEIVRRFGSIQMRILAELDPIDLFYYVYYNHSMQYTLNGWEIDLLLGDIVGHVPINLLRKAYQGMPLDQLYSDKEVLLEFSNALSQDTQSEFATLRANLCKLGDPGPDYFDGWKMELISVTGKNQWIVPDDPQNMYMQGMVARMEETIQQEVNIIHEYPEIETGVDSIFSKRVTYEEFLDLLRNSSIKILNFGYSLHDLIQWKVVPDTPEYVTRQNYMDVMKYQRESLEFDHAKVTRLMETKATYPVYIQTSTTYRCKDPNAEEFLVSAEINTPFDQYVSMLMDSNFQSACANVPTLSRVEVTFATETYSSDEAEKTADTLQKSSLLDPQIQPGDISLTADLNEGTTDMKKTDPYIPAPAGLNTFVDTEHTEFVNPEDISLKAALDKVIADLKRTNPNVSDEEIQAEFQRRYYIPEDSISDRLDIQRSFDGILEEVFQELEQSIPEEDSSTPPADGIIAHELDDTLREEYLPPEVEDVMKKLQEAIQSDQPDTEETSGTTSESDQDDDSPISLLEDDPDPGDIPEERKPIIQNPDNLPPKTDGEFTFFVCDGNWDVFKAIESNEEYRKEGVRGIVCMDYNAGGIPTTYLLGVPILNEVDGIRWKWTAIDRNKMFKTDDGDGVLFKVHHWYDFLGNLHEDVIWSDYNSAPFSGAMNEVRKV